MTAEQPNEQPVKQRVRAKLRKRKSRQPSSHPICSGTPGDGFELAPNLPAAPQYRHVPGRLRRWLQPKQFACLTWGLTETLRNSSEYEAVGILRKALSKGKLRQKVVADFVEHLKGLPGNSLASRYLCLVTGYALGILSKRIASFDENLLSARLASASETDDLDAEQAPLEWLWMQVELPLILGVGRRGFDEWRLAQLLEQYSAFVEQTLTEEGWLPPIAVGEFLALHGSLLRCLIILKYLEQPVDERIFHRLEWMTRNAFRLMGSHGRQLLGDGDCVAFKALAMVAGLVTEDRQDVRLLKAARSGKIRSARRLPDPSGCCETSQTAVLRSGWDTQDCKAAWMILDQAHRLQIDSRETWLQGDCTPRISCNGKILGPAAGTVHLNCWHSDEDADFLEWQTQLDDQIIWQRQLVLAKRERLLFLGDVFLGGEPVRWDYACQFPTPPTVEIETASDSRELTLRSHQSVARVLPVSLGEWKVDHTDDEIRISPEGFEIRQSQIGRSMMVGWAIDLDRRRSLRPATWRHLTVAENLERTPRDRAVAFRIQSGTAQWLIYRSMTSNSSRSFLGQNVWCEFYLGRFSPDGTAESLVSVE